MEIEADLDENADRIITMTEHMKNVVQEQEHVKALADSRIKEREAAQHMKTMAEREAGRFKLEINKLREATNDVVSELNQRENDLFRVQEEMDSVREQMNWNEAEMKEWLEQARVREEDAEVLERYARTDEAKIKELMLESEKLTAEAKEKKRQLDREITETHAHEMGLDKVGALFKEVHKERAELLELWEGCVNSMQQRDEEIQKAAERFQVLKAKTAKINADVAEKAEDQKQMQELNAQAQAKIDHGERSLSKMQQEQSRLEQQLFEFQGEVDALRNTVARATNDEVKKRAEVKKLKETIAEREQDVKQLEIDILVAQEKLTGAGKTAMSAEDQTKTLEAMLNDEEENEKALTRALEQATKRLTKQMQAVHNLKAKEMALRAEINGSTQAEKNLGSRLRKLDREDLNQQQLMYKQDFEIANISRRLNRLEGAVTVDETKMHKAKNDELNEILKGHTEAETLLKVQIRKLSDDMRLAKKAHERGDKERGVQSGKLEELELYNKTTTQELDRKIAEKENLMVEENLLRLEIRRLRSHLNQRADSVFSLEQRELQLKSAMDERFDEIKVHKTLLTSQLRSVNEALATVTSDLSERNTRISQLNKKHDIVMFSMKGAEGEEEHSQAYLIVKAAQEREELQAKGDQLDAKIRRSEKEVRALENTLQLMNGRNEQYRQTVRRAGGEGDDMDEKERLEGQLRTALDKYKHKRRELRSHQEELTALTQTLNEISEEDSYHRDEVNRLAANADRIDRELSEQQGKKERATRQAQKLVSKHRREAGDPQVETVEEKDFKLRYLKDFNRKMIDGINAAAAKQPDVGAELSMLYDRAGIVPPSRSGSVTSSMYGSSRGGSSVASSKYSSKNAAGVTLSRKQPATAAEAAAAYQARTRVVTPKAMEIGDSLDLGLAGMGVRPSSTASSRPASAARSGR